MATLVLTAVGTAVGGPIGGAIGALVGRSVDAALFAPTRREGPRLVELAVQTSSYGAQIPKLFGTMRVAGTVIWATDLIESRATSRSGKGQPSVSTYSYAASFAVLLSARAILGDATPVETRCTMHGASVVPPAPVHLTYRSEADGSATVRWVRRSRAGWRWIDGVDAPLAEESEAYRVVVVSGEGARTIDVAVPWIAVTAAERAGSVGVTVRQRGVFGESLAAALILPA